MQIKKLPEGCNMYVIIYMFDNVQPIIRNFTQKIVAISEAEAEKKLRQMYKQPIRIHSTSIYTK